MPEGDEDQGPMLAAEAPSPGEEAPSLSEWAGGESGRQMPEDEGYPAENGSKPPQGSYPGIPDHREFQLKDSIDREAEETEAEENEQGLASKQTGQI